MSDQIRISHCIYEFFDCFKFTDVQRGRKIEVEDLIGRTIEHIEMDKDNSILLTLKESE